MAGAAKPGRTAAAPLLSAFLLGVLLGALLAGGAAAQQARPPFLYLNEERILTGSRTGAALLEQEAAARDALRAEARRIEAAFEEEERRLTERRAEMEPEDFRKLADEFDARVVEARRQQDERAAQLAQEFDQKRREFYADVGPALVGLMERLGAMAILDEQSVLLADQSINITDEVIAEIDRRAAAAPGGESPGAPQPQAPAGGAPAAPAPGPAEAAPGAILPAPAPEATPTPRLGLPAARPAEGGAGAPSGRIFGPAPRPQAGAADTE